MNSELSSEKLKEQCELLALKCNALGGDIGDLYNKLADSKALHSYTENKLKQANEEITILKKELEKEKTKNK
ncbi:hypothetical protein AXI59_01150 [Bacillus nakamurai]|uniref:hypothetical protein n=1 Tax=Bacillus TaxID=1386 RepID=UPI00077870F1|nr:MULTISPECIES: hypothetical protein [Bacillus]KXZ17887.1 hypothetical protein AXI59_01150 [Bacillus nakamurai]MDQ8093960.1 hypothetical protein [Bacillus amyloliquefaciens]QXP98327.1 hypothetical protein KVY05_06345 [Bacillus velezensis]UHH04153.1 hypothetical protein LUA14_06385 [Bacillus amyloliquefaciens]ULR23881.1 hypothetical protein MJE83_06385 [Bacillus velezensis]